MSDDLVERLRDDTKHQTWEDLTGLIFEAADEIERLRGDLNKRMNALEENVAQMRGWIDRMEAGSKAMLDMRKEREAMLAMRKS